VKLWEESGSGGGVEVGQERRNVGVGVNSHANEWVLITRQYRHQLVQ